MLWSLDFSASVQRQFRHKSSKTIRGSTALVWKLCCNPRTMIGGASTPKYQGVNCGSIRRTVYVDWITDLWNPSVLCNALMIQLYPGNGNCVICIHQNVLYGFQCFAIGTYWERCCRSWGIIHGEW